MRALKGLGNVVQVVFYGRSVEMIHHPSTAAGRGSLHFHHAKPLPQADDAPALLADGEVIAAHKAGLPVLVHAGRAA